MPELAGSLLHHLLQGGEERGEGGKERVGKRGVGRRGWERGGEEWEWMIVGLVREELRVRVRVREMVCMLAQECSHSRKVEVCVFLLSCSIQVCVFRCLFIMLPLSL